MFYMRTDSGRYRAQCKRCMIARVTEYERSNREAINAKRRAYRATSHGRTMRRGHEKRYLASEKGRAARREAARRWTFRRRAHGAVREALLRGILTKEPCKVCGNPNSEAHHHNGYEREHRLDVVWLCRIHHMEEDGRRPRSA